MDKKDKYLLLTALVFVGMILAFCISDSVESDVVITVDPYYSNRSPVSSYTESTTAAASEKTVNLNTASADEIASTLPGIGPSKAKSIVEYREAIGGFKSVDELLEIKGIGEKILERIRPYCRLED